MRPSRVTQVISVKTKPAPPSAREPRCTRWKSLGVPSTALYISIGETTTRLRSSSSRNRKGTNIGGIGAPAEPALDPPDVGRVAQAKIFVADALAAGEQAVRELLGRQGRVTRNVLEPLGRVTRGVLQLENLDLSRPLRTAAARVEIVRRASTSASARADRILHRQLRARADREVRGVCRVADQHDVAVGPAFVADACEVEPVAAP